MSKNIVVCIDGTWNKPDQMDRGCMVPSNVVKMARAVSDKDKSGKLEQIYYYDRGVGTGNLTDKIVGGITGAGLVVNTKQAYSFLCQHFSDGDKIFIFGFSRGAYTARYLACLIGRIGIRKDLHGDPKATRIEKVEKAFNLSRKGRGRSDRMPDDIRREIDAFKNTNCHADNSVHFLGVWDTVGSMGIPVKAFRWIGRWRFKFVNVELGPHVNNAFQALAIDEERKNFQPTLWKTENLAQHQRVEQVWFPGVHTNIGGGYSDTGLSDRALLWMVLNAESCGLGIDGEYMLRRTEPNYHGELRESHKGIWKLFGIRPREICGSGGVNQCLHFSAGRRIGHTTNAYWPNNLLDVYQRNPNPTAEILDGELRSHYFGDYEPVGTPRGFKPESWSKVTKGVVLLRLREHLHLGR